MVLLVNNAWKGTGVGRYIDSIFKIFIKEKKDIEMLYIKNSRDYGEKNKLIKIMEGPFPKAEINNYFYFPRKIPKGENLYHITNETIGRCCSSKPSVGSCMDLIPFLYPSNYNKSTLFFRKRQLAGLKKAEKVIAISENTKKDFIKITKTAKEKVEVVYLGVDTSIFKKRDKEKSRKTLGLPQDKNIIIHVGRDEPRKNVAGLIKIFPGCGKDTILLKVGNLSEQSRILARKLGVEKRIIEMSPKDSLMPIVYSSADVFVFPSFYEGFGLPILEAMACGVPVVASNTSSIPEVVENSGIMHSPQDITGLSESIKSIFNSKSLSNSISKKGLLRASVFTWEKCAKKTWEVYEGVMK